MEAHHRVRVGELLVLHLPERGQPVDEELVRGDGAPRARPDERRLADVVRVLVREHEELDVLEAEAERREACLERRERLRRVRARVDQRQRLAPEDPDVDGPDGERRREDDELAHATRPDGRRRTAGSAAKA